MIGYFKKNFKIFTYPDISLKNNIAIITEKIADIKTYHIFNFNANFIINIFAVRNIRFWKLKQYIFKVLLIGKYFHKFYKMYLQFPNILI